MKAYRTKHKLITAYQIKEPQAALQNPQLNPVGGRVIVRVVQWVSGAWTGHQNWSETATSIESVKSDMIASAILTNYQISGTAVGTGGLKYAIPDGQVLGIYTLNYKAYRIVDIALDPGGSIMTSASNSAEGVVTVTIGMQFDSGATDDLALPLVGQNLLHTYPDLDATETLNYGHIVRTGPVGSDSGPQLKMATYSTFSGLDGLFHAFTWSKYYRVHNTSTQSLELPCTLSSRSEATPFVYGWGIAKQAGSYINNIVPAQTELGWCQGAYPFWANPYPIFFTWSTGRSDMTKTFVTMPEAEDMKAEEEYQTLIEHDPVHRFFGVTPPFSNIGHSNIQSAQFRPGSSSSGVSWGQQFGWLGGVPYNSLFQGNNVSQIYTGNIWGVPGFWRVDSEDGGECDVVDSFTFSEGYNGGDDPSRVMYGGLTGSTSQEPGNAYGSLNANFANSQIYSGPTGQNTYYDPKRQRYHRIVRADETPVSMLGYAGKDVAFWSVSSYLNTNQLFPYQTSYDKAKNWLAWIPSKFGTPNWVTYIRQTGSVAYIRANMGRNFFYTGGQNIGGDRVITPVHKGYGAYIKIIRYANVNVPNMSAVSGVIANLDESNGGSNVNPTAMIVNASAPNETQVGTDSGAQVNLGNKRFNGIDLLFNQLFKNFCYPDTKDTFGISAPNIAQMEPNQYARAVGMFKGNTPFGVIGGENVDAGAVQFIAYLVDGFSSTESQYSSASAPKANSYTTHHPLESKWDKLSVGAFPASNTYQYAQKSEIYNIQFTINTNMGETAGSNVGAVYPGLQSTPSVNKHHPTATPNFLRVGGIPTGGYSATSWTSASPVQANSASPWEEGLSKIRVGATPVLEILSSSVAVTNEVGTDDISAGFPYNDENKGLTVTYKLKYRYIASTTAFQTAAGSRTVTVSDVPILNNRVDDILEIWPHIEVIPLSRLSDDVTTNPIEGGLAYRNIIESGDDVDDAFINTVGGEADTYMLTIKISATSDDVYDNPDHVAEAVDLPFSAIVPDVPYEGNVPDYRAGQPTKWSEGYANSDVDGDTGFSKASFIVVAASPNWEGQADTNWSGTSYPTSSQFVIQTPYVTYGVLTDQTVPNQVTGCTDETAINYDPLATSDDGSCEFCNNILDATFDVYALDTIFKLGVFDYGSHNNIYRGGVAGAGTADVIGFISSSWLYMSSTEQRNGGVVVCNNDYAGDPAVTNLSIKTAAGANLSNVSTALTFLNTQYGESFTAWRLKIYAANDDMVNQVPFSSWSNTQQGVITSDNVPTAIAAATPIYDSYANGGTIVAPEWRDISTPDNILSGLKAGVFYITELILDPTKVDAIECASFLAKEYRMYGSFFTALCGCGTLGNEYHALGLNGYSYAWSDVSAFPILPYETASKCPDTPTGGAFGDYPYQGTGANPSSVCFMPDEQLGSCDTYWLACVEGPFVSCGDASDITTLDDAIDLGGGVYQFPWSATLQTNVEGVYNSNTNQLELLPNIQYTVNVSNGNGYDETQTAADTINSGYYINEFAGITEPGEYTVTITLTDPYQVPAPSDAPCVYTTSVIVTGDECPSFIAGCTDAAADNFDPNATWNDGSCTFTDPCDEIYLNSAYTLTVSNTASESTCGTDTITYEGNTYEITVPVPTNNGTITAVVDYENTPGAITSYAIALLPENAPLLGSLQTTVEALDALFQNYPTGNQPIDLPGTGTGEWSPLFTIGTAPDPNTYTFTGLAPGVYYVLVVPNILTDTTGGLSTTYFDCSGQPFISFQQFLDKTIVGMTAPAGGCEEDCAQPPCNEFTFGCTDPNATNYNEFDLDPPPSYDDGSCVYEESFCEQNPNDALCADCTEAQVSGSRLSAGTVGVKSVTGTLDETICDPVIGTDGECTDPNACNYNPNAPLDTSNNLLCDYCSCVPADDPDCYPDTGCDPAEDPNCFPPEPECPDPNNPLCDPVIVDPCPTGDCVPPGDPCLFLGNCPEGPDEGGDPPETFVDDVAVVEVTCAVNIDSVDSNELGFAAVQDMAFTCMGMEGGKLLFKLKSGVECSKEELTKLSLIAYLFAGGLEQTELPCLFNCNYESDSRQLENDCVRNWIANGRKVWNSSDTFVKGDVVVYYYLKHGVVTRAYYTATRTITGLDNHPRYQGSGWHSCKKVQLRTVDRNNIATGEEEYLRVMWEYLTRYCTQCSISTNRGTIEEKNTVDPTTPKNYLDPRVENESFNNSNSGILGEDGEEIIF